VGASRTARRTWELERDALVESLVRRGYANEPRLIEALRKVPRHEFVPPHVRVAAYDDTPLSIGEGQTISAPHMVAIMVEALNCAPGQRVLEVGGGSGYHAAVVAELVGISGRIYSVERIASLAEAATSALERTGYSDRVTVVVGDGSLGLPEHAPYDRIFVSCAAPYIPPPLAEQLAEGGRLVIPVGSRWAQDLLLVDKEPSGLRQTNGGGCVFVPLIGAYGFPD